MSEPSKSLNSKVASDLPAGSVLPLVSASKVSAWDSPIFGSGVDLEQLARELSDELGMPSLGQPTSQTMVSGEKGMQPIASLANGMPAETAGWPHFNEPALTVLPPVIKQPEKSRRADQVPSTEVRQSAAVPLQTFKKVQQVAPTQFVVPPTTEVWGMKLSQVTMGETIEAIAQMVQDRVPRYIITANLNYAMLLGGNPNLAKTTAGAAMVLADGQPLVWRSRWSSDGPVPERVTGSELIYQIAQQAAIHGWRIYFLGAEPGVAQKCATELAKRYPGLQIAGVQSPPYRKLTEEESQKQREEIKAARPDILFVAFGQPKGEQWIEENYQQLGVPVSIQIGASFDFVAGRSKRAPKVFQMLALEWAYRMMCDPKRLVPRYAANAWFLFCMMLQEWKAFVDKRFGVDLPQSQVVSQTQGG